MYTGSSRSDLFERDRSRTGQRPSNQQHDQGTYSPLETLVRQTSQRQKNGWRSAGASPTPAGTSSYSSNPHRLDREVGGQEHPLGTPLHYSGKTRNAFSPASNDHDVSYTSQSGQLTPDRYLDQNHLHIQQQQQGRGRPPSSPLLHTQFRQSTATSLNDLDGGSFLDTSYDASGVSYSAVGDSTLDASTSTAGGLAGRGFSGASTKPPLEPLRLPNRLTIDDTMTDREQYRWDSDDADSPLDGSGSGPSNRVASYTRNVLPPSFQFVDEDDELELPSPNIRDGGRPLSDRSFVLPPASVKGLSIRHKSGLSSHAASGSGSGGGNGNGYGNTSGGVSPSPISPAQMSFYSESSYSNNSGPNSAVPSLPPASSSFPRHTSSNPGSSFPTSSTYPLPSTSPQPRASSSLRPSMDAPSESDRASSESSIYDDAPDTEHHFPTTAEELEQEDGDDLDFAAALESAPTRRWAPSPSPNLDPGGHSTDPTPTIPPHAAREVPMPSDDRSGPQRVDSKKKTRQSDLEPFAFRHYERRDEDNSASSLSKTTGLEGERGRDHTENALDGEPRFNIIVHSSSPTRGQHRQEPSASSLGQELALDVSPQPSPAASPIVSSYPYLPSPTHSPVILPSFEKGASPELGGNESRGMAQSASTSTVTAPTSANRSIPPRSSPQPSSSTPTITATIASQPNPPIPVPPSPSEAQYLPESTSRAPSLVASASKKKFNFSRPMRSSVIASVALNSASSPTESEAQGGGRESLAYGGEEEEERSNVDLYANIISVLPGSPDPTATMAKSTATTSTSWDDIQAEAQALSTSQLTEISFSPPQPSPSAQSPIMPSIPDIQITNSHRLPSGPNRSYSQKSPSAIRPSLYRNSSGSALSSASRGSAATGEESMRYYMVLEQNFPAPPGSAGPVVVLEPPNDGGGAGGGGGGMAGVGSGGRGMGGGSPRRGNLQGPPSPGMLSTPEMFSSPRAAPRPPSPNSPLSASPNLSPHGSPYSPRPQLHSPMMLPGSTSTATVTIRQDASASPSPSRLAPRALGLPSSPNPSATTLVNGQSSPGAGGRPEASSGSRMSLYSNYSFYGVPESPGSSPHQSSTNLSSPSGMGSRNVARSPGLSPMNPYSDAQGRLTPSKQGTPLSYGTPMLSPAQLTPEGLYQPQYVAEGTGLEGQRSLFKRKKQHREKGSGGSLPNMGGTRGSDGGSYFPAGAGSFGEKLSPGTPDPSLPRANTAEEYLQLGITHHEADSLALSAYCFEQAATLGGGCGFGMLMWGLTLRHGWGVKKDERMGFAWVKQAADAAVGDLEAAVEGVEADAVRNELVLAIFEVGQCYSKGWGVKEDKKLAFGYFQVAARLGDSGAQEELGFCYANGKGCKKDKKEAAKWYRAAAAQGVSTVGLAWIFKEKYNS